MLLVSTRDAANQITPLNSVLKGIADDGGLYVPSSFPTISTAQLNALKGKSYPEIAAEVLGMYFDIGEETLLEMARSAYQEFDTDQIVPIKKIGNQEYVLELFHGPTLAFKDMALQFLPRLMSEGIKKSEIGKDILILTATSGDTGKAALEGFKDVPRTKIVVFYPEEGVSDMQKLQMITQEGENTYVSAVKGNFDDAQTGVKSAFSDREFSERLKEIGYNLSSANSINFGRLAPQIVYYIYGYVRLLEQQVIEMGDPINVCVPTGNFGNILSAYYAKRMGIPIKRLICASNKNNVLTDFFDSGTYFARRSFFRTISPSMDILISSNLERLIFELMGRDSVITANLMRDLMENGTFNIPDDITAKMSEDFYADFCDDQSTLSTIKKVFAEEGYVMDTHTAVAKAVYDGYVSHTDDHTPVLLASTASPYKFASDVVHALTGERVDDAFTAAEMLEKISGVKIPEQISELQKKPVRHKDVFSKDELEKAVLGFVDRLQ